MCVTTAVLGLVGVSQTDTIIFCPLVRRHHSSFFTLKGERFTTRMWGGSRPDKGLEVESDVVGTALA